MRVLSDQERDRIRERLITECQQQTGFTGPKHPIHGCSQRWTNRQVGETPGFEIPYLERADCRCLELFMVMHRHADFGFDAELFSHRLEDVKLVDRQPLDDYLADPKQAWEGRGLFIFGGGIGCGKTTLAHLVTKQLYLWGRNNRYVAGGYKTWYMLASEFAERAWRGRDGFKQKFTWGGEFGETEVDLWDVAGVVVLDELGREDRNDAKTKAGRSALEALLRDRSRLPTIVVSHIAPPDASSALSPQIASLLSRMTVVEVTGGDRRAITGNPFYDRG